MQSCPVVRSGEKAQEEGMVYKSKDREKNISSRNVKKSSGCNRRWGKDEEVWLWRAFHVKIKVFI